MGDGRSAVTAAGLLCGSCGTELPPDSRFCNKCGASVRPAATAAEYKQVRVLFADVVHSMDIAAAVGAERPKVAQDRYALGETFLHREDRALGSVNCGSLVQSYIQPSQFPGAYDLAVTA